MNTSNRSLREIADEIDSECEACDGWGSTPSKVGGMPCDNHWHRRATQLRAHANAMDHLATMASETDRIVQETERRVREEMGATIIATIEAFKPKPSGRIDTGELWRGATVVNIRDAVRAAIKGAKS